MDRGLTRVAAGVVLAVTLTACGSSGVHNKGATGSLEAPPSTVSTVERPVDLPGRAVQVFKPRGLQQALTALQRAIGTPARFTEIVLYPEYAVVTARRTGHPNRLERWLFRGGTVDDMGPEMVTTPQDLDAITFTRDDVVWEVVPNLVPDSRARFATKGVKTTHMIIERDPVFAQGQLVIRVYAMSPAANGYVEYDARGGLRRVVR
jgi:hypothetical protein